MPCKIPEHTHIVAWDKSVKYPGRAFRTSKKLAKEVGKNPRAYSHSGLRLGDVKYPGRAFRTPKKLAKVVTQSILT